MLAWRGGVPARHPQPAPCIRPARLCLSSPPRSSGLPQPPLPAAHTYSRLNVPLGFLPGSSAPPCSLSWVCLSVCQVPKWIWDLQDQQERNVKLKWSPGGGCWPQSRVAGSPRCGWDTCRASLWHLSTAGNTDHKGKNHSVVDALVSLGPVSGEFRGPKHPPSPREGTMPHCCCCCVRPRLCCTETVPCPRLTSGLWPFSPYLCLLPATQAAQLLSPRLEVHAKPGAGTKGATNHSHFSEVTSQGN